MSNVCILCMKPGLKHSIPKMSLHVFPSCPKKRQIWLNQCKLANKEVLPNSKICSFHFEPTCFKTGAKRRVLNRDAVPTIFGNNHVKSTNLPLKIVKGRPKNCTKNGIVVQNRNSRDISSAKTAKKVVAGQNCESRVVTPRFATNANTKRLKTMLDCEKEIDRSSVIIAELSAENLTLVSLLDILVRNQII